jgi:hypothetical protein
MRHTRLAPEREIVRSNPAVRLDEDSFSPDPATVPSGPSSSMDFLQQAAIFLVTAVIVVPLFRRMRLGAVLGYLPQARSRPWGLGLTPTRMRHSALRNWGSCFCSSSRLELEPSGSGHCAVRCSIGWCGLR